MNKFVHLSIILQQMNMLCYVYIIVIYNKNSLMKIVVLCLLVVAASCTYNATLAKKLAIASGAAFATDAEIAQWSCKVCSGLPLVRVNNII